MIYGKKCNMLSAALFAAGLFACASAWALTLEEARTLALANSRSLAKYHLAVQSGVLDEKAQTFANLPTLSLGASASTGLWAAGGAFSDPLAAFRAGANLGLSQTIFEGGRSLVEKAIARLSTESARQDALAAYFSVLDEVDGAYYAELEAAADLEAAESALRTADLALSMAEVRHAAGMITGGDYLKALSEKETGETTRNQARRNLSLCAMKLRGVVGLADASGAQELDFSGYEALIGRLGAMTDGEADALYGELQAVVRASNPSLARAGISRVKAEQNLSLARRSFSPSVGVSFSTGLNYTRGGGAELSGGSVTISGSVPLDIWAKANSVARSRLALDTAALDFRIAGVSLETELQSALFDAITQAGSAGSSCRALEYAEKHFEYVMERYRLSQSSVSELSDASALVSASRGRFIKARYGFLRSLSALRSLGAFGDEEKLLHILSGGHGSAPGLIPHSPGLSP
jgi:outer membrane protein TolC